MIDDLLDIRVFVSVATAGSQSAAARGLDMSLAAVSKRLVALERRLGVALVHRTTRSQSLTTEGQAFLTHCTHILREVQSAETLIAVSQKRVSGQLTIAAPQTFGRLYLAPLVAEFHHSHPDLDIRLLLDDERGDLVGSGIDLSFRFGALADSTLSVRPIAPNYLMLCASPEYLRLRGVPETAADLIDHACIVRGTHAVQTWSLQVGGLVVPISIRPRFVVSDGEAAQLLAQRGAGIYLASVWDVAQQLDVGRLIPVLPQCALVDEPMQLVFPQGRQIAPRLRHFIEFAIERLRATRAWERDWMAATKQPIIFGAPLKAPHGKPSPTDAGALPGAPIDVAHRGPILNRTDRVISA